jgi:hypothetical protein
MGAQPQGRTEDDFVENSRTGIHEQMTALRRLHNTVEVPGVHSLNREGRVVPEKGARTARIAITTGHLMPLTDKQFGQQRACRTDPKNKDPHGVATLPQLSGHFAAPSALVRILLQGADSEGSPRRTFNEGLFPVLIRPPSRRQDAAFPNRPRVA